MQKVYQGYADKNEIPYYCRNLASLMKHPYLLLAACMLSFASFSQLKSITPVKTAFSQAISSILKDFSDNFHNISGELLLSQGEIDNYECKVKMPGAEECFITRYHSEEDATASWQAKMYQDESFKNASARYRDLYRQLKGCYLQTVDGTLLYVKGEWEEPNEGKAFVSSLFRVITGDERYKDVQIELEMRYQLPEWIINISIASKKKDTLD